MPAAVPAGVYGRRIPAGGFPILAAIDPSAAFRITMAAIDPDAEPQIDEDHKVPRATLRIIRVPMDFEDDSEDDEDYDPEDIEALAARLREAGALPEADSDSDLSDEDDSADEKNGGPSDPAKSKKAKQAALTKKLQQELEEEMEIDDSLTNGVNGKAKGKAKITVDDLSEDDDDEDDDEDEEPEELVLCTLDPERHCQQPLDITVREGEEVYLSVTGTHDVYVTGNYVAFPDEEDSEDDEDDGLDELEYDLSPDGDELDLEEIDESEDDELDTLDDPRIAEIDSEEEAPKLVESNKKGKKRPAESEDDATLDDLISKTNGDSKASKKQAKKLKKNDGQATAGAETAKKETKADKGPTGSPKVDAPKAEAKKEASKGPRVIGGVTVDDKKEGKGKAAKKGDRVEMRYIGKLKNGKVFDSNKKGKPFAFKLGVGQVIKGWDVGVVGMTPGGERRLTIPAALAYGKKGAPPDIPPNSDLIFDIKCISVS
ncbi:peptidylprolyl isomerase fpr3 [Coniothyrium glycines]